MVWFFFISKKIPLDLSLSLNLSINRLASTKASINFAIDLKIRKNRQFVNVSEVSEMKITISDLETCIQNSLCLTD